MSRHRRLPGESCAFCDRALSYSSGKRITWSSAAGIVMRGYNDAIGRIPFRAVLERLPEPHGGVLVLWPPDSDALDRSLSQWIAGFRPWTCQVCAGRTCSRCGNPEKHPFGADILGDDGRVRHVPLLPGSASCVLDGCSQ